MKKLAIILATLLLVPFTAFGLEMLNDNVMDDVTGQAGVSIAADDVQIYLNIEKLAYTDDDGLMQGTTQVAGGASISMGLEMDIITINAITSQSGELESTGMALMKSDYSTTNFAVSSFVPQAIEIDVVDALPTLTKAAEYKYGAGAKVAGVYITIPTMEVFINKIDINPITIQSVAGGSINDGRSFGTFTIEEVTFTLLSGWLEIAAH